MRALERVDSLGFLSLGFPGRVRVAALSQSDATASSPGFILRHEKSSEPPPPKQLLSKFIILIT